MLLAKAQQKGHSIKFDVLYYAKSRNYDDIYNEIGEKEGYYIRKHNPSLNTQIPKEENWKKYTCRSIDDESILSAL